MSAQKSSDRTTCTPKAHDSAWAANGPPSRVARFASLRGRLMHTPRVTHALHGRLGNAPVCSLCSCLPVTRSTAVCVFAQNHLFFLPIGLLWMTRSAHLFPPRGRPSLIVRLAPTTTFVESSVVRYPPLIEVTRLLDSGKERFFVCKVPLSLCVSDLYAAWPNGRIQTVVITLKTCS